MEVVSTNSWMVIVMKEALNRGGWMGTAKLPIHPMLLMKDTLRMGRLLVKVSKKRDRSRMMMYVCIFKGAR